jgi:TATA-box binding protein (TBP) (component of TFIID and TFIIIB)
MMEKQNPEQFVKQANMIHAKVHQPPDIEIKNISYILREEFHLSLEKLAEPKPMVSNHRFGRFPHAGRYTN